MFIEIEVMIQSGTYLELSILSSVSLELRTMTSRRISHPPLYLPVLEMGPGALCTGSSQHSPTESHARPHWQNVSRFSAAEQSPGQASAS